MNEPELGLAGSLYCRVFLNSAAANCTPRSLAFTIGPRERRRVAYCDGCNSLVDETATAHTDTKATGLVL